MKKRRLQIALPVLLVVFILTLLAGRLLQGEDTRLPVTTQLLTSRDLERNIPVMGVVIPLQTSWLRAPVSEVITGIFAHEGEEISARQLLFTLEERELQLNLKETQLQLLQAKREYEEGLRSQSSQEEEGELRIQREMTNIERAKEALERLKNEAEREELRFARQIFSLEREIQRVQVEGDEIQSLYAVEAVSHKELQQVENRLQDLIQDLADTEQDRDLYLEVILPQQLRSAHLDVRQAKESLAEVTFSLQQSQITEEDFGVKKARIAQLEERLRIIEEDLEKTHLYSQEDGQIISLLVEKGELVTRSQPLMQIFPGGTYGVEASLDEMDMGSIRRGQMVRITSEAYPGKMALGRMEWIAPRARQQGNIALFDVEIKVLDGWDFLKLGMFVDLEIITATGEDILVLPVQALRRMNGYPTVFVVEDGQAKRRNVVTGIETLTLVEIQEGLEEGEEIITGSFAVLQQLEDGMEVRVKERGIQNAH